MKRLFYKKYAAIDGIVNIFLEYRKGLQVLYAVDYIISRNRKIYNNFTLFTYSEKE